MPLLLSVIAIFMIILPRFGAGLSEKTVGRLSYGMIIAAVIPVLYWNLMVASWGTTSLKIDLSRLVTTILELGKETTLGSQILARQVLLFPDVGWVKRILFILIIVPAFPLVLRRLVKRKLKVFDLLFLVMAGTWFVSSLVTELSDRMLCWVVPLAAVAVVDFFGSDKRMPSRISASSASRIMPLATLVLLAPLTFATFHSGDAAYITTKGEYVGFSDLVSNLVTGDRVYSRLKYQLYFYKYTNTDYLTPDLPTYGNVFPLPVSLFDVVYWEEGKPTNSFTAWVDESLEDAGLNLVYNNPGMRVLRATASRT